MESDRFANNPLKLVRKAYGLTQLEVAQSLGITRQVIVDNEAGLVTRPNPKYLALLSKEDDALASALSDAWHAWRSALRADSQGSDGPAKLIEALSNAAQPPDTFSAVITLCSPDSGFSNEGIRTFARMFLLQTSVINAYVNRGTHWPSIRQAFEEANFSPALIAMLHSLPRNELTRRARV